MKKPIVLIVLLYCWAVLSAQQDLSKILYLRAGYSMSSKAYLGVDDNNFWNGVTTYGLTGDVGQIFILNSIPLGDGLRLGINADYASGYFHKLKSDTFNLNFFTLGSKVGPSISYSPFDKLVFDAYFKVNPVWMSAVISAEEEINSTDYQLFLGFLGIGYSFGVNIRYSLLIVGFEFNKSWNKMQHYDEGRDEFDGTYLGNFSDSEKDRTPMPSYNFTIGVAF